MPPPARNHPYDEIEQPQDYVERKPFRWGRFLVLSFLLLVTLAILGHWWWSRRGEKALAAQMAEYAKRGEPTTFDDFNDPPIADAMNAVLDLRAAAAAIALTDAQRKRFESVTRIIPFTDKETAFLEKLLAERGKIFEHVEVAKTKPAVNWGIKFQSPWFSTLLPDINAQRDLANFVALAALLAHQRGDDDAAIRHVESLLFISRAMRKQPFLVSHLSSSGITALATDVLRQMAPDLRVEGRAAAQSSGTSVTRKRVQDLIAQLLDDAPAGAAFRRAMHAERISQLDGTNLLARGDMRFIQGAFGGPGSGAPPAFAIIARILRPIIYEDGVMMMRHTTAVADASSEETLPAARAKSPPFPWEVKRSPIHVNAHLFMPALDRAVDRHYASIMERRATAVALAIRLYAIDHDGKLPERLEDLTPNYLMTIPADPFARADPIKYQLGANPILYGLGNNGADDGGSDLDSRGKPANGSWNALDMVFHLTRQPRPIEDVPETDVWEAPLETEVTEEAIETEERPRTPERSPQ